MGKAWPALDIHVPSCDPQLKDLVLAELDDFQPTAIQEPDDTSRLRAFFTSTESRDAALRSIRASFGTHLFVESINIDDEDWAARSQAHLTAVRAGRVIVAPPWEKRGRELSGVVPGSDPRTVPGSDPAAAPKGYPAPVRGSDPIVVIIQPSMGFGTGHHATTRLMLAALQELPLEDRTVLDIGCGSGVLGIAAVKLGARSAVGIDVDPDALANARENAALNDIHGRLRFQEGDFREMALLGDVVMANLTGALLENSAAALAATVAPGGCLIVSGFMETEGAAIVRAFESRLTLQTSTREDEWMCALFRRDPHA